MRSIAEPPIGHVPREQTRAYALRIVGPVLTYHGSEPIAGYAPSSVTDVT